MGTVTSGTVTKKKGKTYFTNPGVSILSDASISSIF